MRAYLEEKLALARTGEFTGHVIGTVARDETLSEAERVANLGVVIFAGFETTTGLLSKGFDALLRHPAAMDVSSRRARAGDAGGRRRLSHSRSGMAMARVGVDAAGRNVDVPRRDRLIAVTQRSPDADARFEAIRAQEEMLDRAVEELLRWTAPGPWCR